MTGIKLEMMFMRNNLQTRAQESLHISTGGIYARMQPESSRLPLRSTDLFHNGANELLIEHRGEFYRLRLTRQNKLILNK